jgi:hypothetical protein
MLNASVLGTTAISLSSAWAYGEVRGWPHSLQLPLRDARGFYSVYFGCLAVAAAIVLIPARSTAGFTRKSGQKRERVQVRVVHSLDDLSDEKRDPSGLGPIPMTLSVRLSLFALRAYLILMAALVAYHFVDSGGLLAVHKG